METVNKQKWEDLNLTRDEIRNIGQALQKEEFRNLLLDYVKEVNDPENRKLYEKEITQLENERGVDVKFLHPSSGYVIKTSVDGKSKAFINICSNSNVGIPTSAPGIDGGHHGLNWSLPYCLAPPREDVDKKNNSCIVYDVVFHPDTLRLSKNNVGFKNFVNDTALGAVEENFNVSLDKVNLKFPKMQFKGAKHPTVIRKKLDKYEPPSDITDIPNYPYPLLQENIKSDEKPAKQIHNADSKHTHKVTKEEKYTTPKYTLKYRNRFDMQHFTNDPLSKMYVTVPNELVIVIDLPLMKSSSDASIDVKENIFFLLSESPKYKLNLNLPYIVDGNNGNAKFDTIKKVLIVTLPVVKNKNCSNLDSARDDSGVESDSCIVRSNSVSSDEEITEKISTVNRKNANKDVNDVSNLLNLDTYTFLKPNIHYVLPIYSCQLLKYNISFTMQVPHVNPDTVEYCFLKNFSGFHLSFLSVGTGFFPVNYAICVLLPYQISDDTFNVEVWDNNVIAQVKLTTSGSKLSEYYVGIDENNVKRITISDSELKFQETGEEIEKKEEKYENNSNEQIDQSGNEKGKSVSADTEDKTYEIPVLAESYSCDIENAPNTKKGEVNDKLSEEEKDLSISESADESTSSPCRQSPKSRTVSESQQGDIMRTKRRGILKIGRSLSESSVDDYVSWSEKNEKTKKTVRFSEVISKQTFRMNSSILGQRKKNQRKTRNKKRAHERRLSESGGESECESEFASLKGKNSGGEREIGIWLNEAESSSCDVSEVSEVSDISESDDGQKDDVKSFMPCSNRKNHKRRGKKSARKNAATAKFQYMEN